MFEAFSNANLNVGAVQVHSLFVLVLYHVFFNNQGLKSFILDLSTPNISLISRCL
jgi:hypothetical protein